MPHGEMTAKKWLDSIEKQKKKKQFEGVWQRDKTESIVDNNDSLVGAEINDNVVFT